MAGGLALRPHHGSRLEKMLPFRQHELSAESTSGARTAPTRQERSNQLFSARVPVRMGRGRRQRRPTSSHVLIDEWVTRCAASTQARTRRDNTARPQQTRVSRTVPSLEAGPKLYSKQAPGTRGLAAVCPAVAVRSQGCSIGGGGTGRRQGPRTSANAPLNVSVT